MRSRCVVGVIAFLLAACGGSPGSASPTPAEDLKSEYLAIIAPINAASNAMFDALDAPQATPASARPSAQGYLDALVKANGQLLTFESHVPPSTKPDVANLRQTLAVYERDVQLVIAATDTSELNSALQQFLSDGQKFGSAAQLVRSDLGLPPPVVS